MATVCVAQRLTRPRKQGFPIPVRAWRNRADIGNYLTVKNNDASPDICRYSISFAGGFDRSDNMVFCAPIFAVLLAQYWRINPCD